MNHHFSSWASSHFPNIDIDIDTAPTGLSTQCPVLARLAHVPPGEALESGKCTLIVELGGGARVFSRFRKVCRCDLITPKRGLLTRAVGVACCMQYNDFDHAISRKAARQYAMLRVN